MRGWLIAAAIIMLPALSANAQQSVVTPAQPSWIADVRTGCRVWNADPRPKETIIWSGRCEDGLAQGHGVLQWFQDNHPAQRSEGEWKDGQMNGHGDSTDANGD